MDEQRLSGHSVANNYVISGELMAISYRHAQPVANALICLALFTAALSIQAAEVVAVTPGKCAALQNSAIESTLGYRIQRAKSRMRTGQAKLCELIARSNSEGTLSLSMPAAGWVGAIAETRCEGSCLERDADLCDSIVDRGYACLVTELGSVDRAHDTLVAAKAIVKAYYQTAPQSALLLACSAAAGEGLREAEHFPADFQGIVAGAPILDTDANRFRMQWLANTLRGAGGKPLLSAEELRWLHQQALASCDANDGIADGLISDPLRCEFPVAALKCSAGRSKDCLSAAQVDAVQRVYEGPFADPANGQLPGSELGWTPSVSLEKISQRKPGIAVSQPDLQKFSAAGGKLLIFQGMADPIVSARKTAQMHEQWMNALGGPVKSTAYVRLFMVPGMQHCTGGEGPYSIDFLRGIENWVVKPAHRAPDDLIAFHPRDDVQVPGNRFAPTAVDPAQNVFSSWQVGVTVTLPESRVQPHESFSRPIYLYPVHTQYKGVGDPNFWRSFYGPSDYPYLLK